MNNLIIFRIFIAVLPLASVFCVIQTYAATKDLINIGIKDFNFEFGLRSGLISNVQTPNCYFVSKGKGGIYFINGKTGGLIIPSEIITNRVSKKRIDYQIKDGLDKVNIMVHMIMTEEAIKWHVEIVNNGDQVQFIEVRLGLPITAANSLNYWDGYDGMNYGYPDGKKGIIKRRIRKATRTSNLVSHAANPSLKRLGAETPRISMPNLEPAMLFVFPVNLLFGEDYGIALGADPNFLMSYYAGGVQPTFTSYESFYYAMKYVIWPGKSEKQGFVLYSFNPDGFGYRPALSKYYEAFPERYKRRKGMNPLALKVGSGLHRGLMDVGKLWPEYARRFYFGYVWFYTGHFKTGEFWPETGEQYKVSAYKKENRAFIEQVQKGCMVGYYTIPNRCELGLARARFPDSEARTFDGKPRIKGKVLKDEIITTMYPWGNSYGDHLKENLFQIVNEGGAQALAFDNAFASDFYYGSKMNSSDGASFIRAGDTKESGANLLFDAVNTPLAYVPIYIGYAHLMDHLRGRFANVGKEVVFIGNGAWALPTAIRCDAGYFEWHWRPPLKRVGIFQAQRYLMGGMRPISYKIAGRWRGDQKHLSPKEHNKIRHERKFSLLHLFRYGGYPVMRKHMGAGDPDCLAALPTLEKLSQAGWMPVSGVRHDEALWVERFGGDGPVYLSVINPTSTFYTGTLKVQNAYLGKGCRWFAPVFGEQGKVFCRSHNGETVMDVFVPATRVQVLESTIEITHANATATVEGWSKVLPEKMIVFLVTDRPGTLQLKAFLPEGGYDAKAEFNNGRVLESSLTGNVLQIFLPVASIEATVELTITWKDAFHLVNRREIMEFPYLYGLQPACEIVVQDGYMKAAKRLQLYFAYWQLQMDYSAWLHGHAGVSAPSIRHVDKIPIAALPNAEDDHTIFIGDADFVRQQADLHLKESSSSSMPASKNPFAFAFSDGVKRLLFLVLSNAQNATLELELFLDTLDLEFPTLPGYDANYDRQRTMDEVGNLYRNFPGQPIMGWNEILEFLQQESGS